VAKDSIAFPGEMAAEPRLLAEREPLFLLECMRSFLRPGLPVCFPSSLDWPKLFALANKHSVIPLLYACLHRAGFEDIPPSHLAELQKTFREGLYRNLALRSELKRVSRVLAGQDIDVRVLKGPVLSGLLYRDPAMRFSSDLDLLVHEEDLFRTKDTLEACGYTLLSSLRWSSNSALLHTRERQCSFKSPLGASVDIHWRLLPDYYPHPFDEAEVWTRRQGVCVDGLVFWTLAQEDLLLFLCAHGAKHHWAMLGWICDLIRLIQVEPQLDWVRVFARVRQSGTSRMLSLALLLGQSLIDDLLSPEALEWVNSDRGAGTVAAAVRNRFLSDAQYPLPPVESSRIMVRTFDRPSQRVRYVIGDLFSPSEPDYLSLSLPPVLCGLYFVIRPARLAAKYLRRGWSKSRKSLLARAKGLLG
jgi:hypothetical protein